MIRLIGHGLKNSENGQCPAPLGLCTNSKLYLQSERPWTCSMKVSLRKRLHARPAIRSGMNSIQRVKSRAIGPTPALSEHQPDCKSFSPAPGMSVST